MRDKPFSRACENNKDPILKVLRRAFARATRVLEIGSGTGQHAVYFAAKLPHLVWMPSDLKQNHDGILAWIEDSPSPNLRVPVELDVRAASWPVDDVDAVFTANTAHIMHWPEVVHVFRGVGDLLPPHGVFVQYGPFNYNGTYTSESNARFDASLRATDPGMGIRDFEAISELAEKRDMRLAEDVGMPANNRTLVWQKT
jgi:SAM-dependent methyltransferase